MVKGGKNGFDAAIGRLERRDAARSAEGQRIREARALGSVPPVCQGGGAWPGISEAPARGAVRLYDPREVQRTEAGGFLVRRTGYVGEGEAAPRRALRIGDAFDVMQEQAERAARRRASEAPALFTVRQIEAGRRYAAISERVAASGMKLGGFEGGSGGGGASGVSEAVLADIERLRRMQAVIDPAWALGPERAAPHRDRREPIGMRVLFDQVCLGGRTLGQVLERFGWTPSTRLRRDLRRAFGISLDQIYDF